MTYLTRPFYNVMQFFAGLFFLFCSTIMLGESDSDVVTAIILINRQAELVDMDQEGEVLRRHLAIPDYFSSGRSHKRSLRDGIKMIKDYGKVPDSAVLPGSSDLAAECLQSFMRSLSSHPMEQNDPFLNAEFSMRTLGLGLHIDHQPIVTHVSAIAPEEMSNTDTPQKTIQQEMSSLLREGNYYNGSSKQRPIYYRRLCCSDEYIT